MIKSSATFKCKVPYVDKSGKDSEVTVKLNIDYINCVYTISPIDTFSKNSFNFTSSTKSNLDYRKQLAVCKAIEICINEAVKELGYDS